jgi:hypothetical protein
MEECIVYRKRDCFFRKKKEGKISIFPFVEKSVYERIIVEIIALFSFRLLTLEKTGMLPS